MRLIIYIVRVIRFITNVFFKIKAIAFISPATCGSLGNEALIRGFLNISTDTAPSITEIVVWPNSQSFTTIGWINKAIFFNDDGRRSSIILLFKIMLLGKVFILGADTIDVSYSPVETKKWINIAKFACNL